MEKKSMFRVKVTGVEAARIKIENTITKESFFRVINMPKKEVLRLLGDVWLGGEGEYATNADDIYALLINLRSDPKLEDFCTGVNDWIAGIGSEAD